MFRDMYCTRCGSTAMPKEGLAGGFFFELFLWGLFVVQGAFFGGNGLWILLLVVAAAYSGWRHSTKRRICPKCGSSDIIPVDSPKARQSRTDSDCASRDVHSGENGAAAM